MEKVKADNVKLKKQKDDLLDAFKKQLTLIDVLKRQVLHMKAAMQLACTERKFADILEM